MPHLVQYPCRDVLTKSYRASRRQASHVDAIGGIDCSGVAGGNARQHADNFSLLFGVSPPGRFLRSAFLIVSEPRVDKVLVSRRQAFVVVRLNDSRHIRLGRYHIVTEKLRPKDWSRPFTTSAIARRVPARCVVRAYSPLPVLAGGAACHHHSSGNADMPYFGIFLGWPNLSQRAVRKWPKFQCGTT
jgi:hypothetical protein